MSCEEALHLDVNLNVYTEYAPGANKGIAVSIQNNREP
jgi:hypothetical protein